MTHLNDISKVYLEKVVYGGSDAKKEPKDDRHVVTNADKRGNTKAWQNYKAGDKRYRAADHVGESAVPGKPAERLGAVTAIPKSEQEAARERLLAKTKAKREAMKTEALDPVGQEDADVDNDGKKNTKSDEYLLKRRAAIKSAISGRKKKVSEAVHATAKQMHSPHEVPSGNLKGLVKKAVKRIDTDVDGDTDNNDKAKGELGEFIPGVGNKRLYSTTKTTTAKESFSNWRNDLREVVGEDDDLQIKEKKVKNKITINPKISEEVTILEMVEITEEFVDEKLNMKKEKMGDVIKDFYKSDAPQFKGKSKEKRREMAIAAKLTAERGGRKLGESATEVAMSPQELALQKRKTQIDQMIAKKRQQSLQKAGKSTNEEVESVEEGIGMTMAKAVGNPPALSKRMKLKQALLNREIKKNAALNKKKTYSGKAATNEEVEQVNERNEKVEAEYKRAKTPHLLSKFRKENPGSRQEKKVPGAKETEGQAANRRRRAQAERAAKHGLTSKEKKETQARSEYYSSRD